MNKQNRILGGLVVLLLNALASNSFFTDAHVAAQDTQEVAAPAVTASHPPPKLQGRVIGELRLFKLTRKDLRASVFAHPLPKLSLVFSTPGPSSTNVEYELPPDAKRALMNCWREELAHYYKREMEPRDDLQTRIADDIALATAISRLDAKLQAITIHTPSTKRNISSDEAGKILEFIGSSAQIVIQQALEHNKVTPFA